MVAKKIFISYRRGDTSAEAHKIYDALIAQMGDGIVFMDVKSILPGTDWRAHLEKTLEEVDTLIVVIGPDWLKASDVWGRRRIDLEEDLVRLEIAKSLEKRINIIPVLVDGASLPPKEALPTVLQNLVDFQSVFIRRDYRDHDMNLLLNLFDNSNRSSTQTKHLNGIWVDYSSYREFSEFDGSYDKVKIIAENDVIRGTYRPSMYGSFITMLGDDECYYGTWTECNHSGSLKLKLNESMDEISGTYTFENGREAIFLLKKLKA
jgi:hypothetical protein